MQQEQYKLWHVFPSDNGAFLFLNDTEGNAMYLKLKLGI